jgi:hypothetical protein
MLPRPKVSPATCTEALSGDSDRNHGSVVLEPGLSHLLEQVKLSEEELPRPSLPPPMPWRGMQLVQEKQGRRLVLKEVATKKPFTLHTSCADGRLRLSHVAHFDDLDEANMCSNGEKDFEGDESGANCKTTSE